MRPKNFIIIIIIIIIVIIIIKSHSPSLSLPSVTLERLFNETQI